MLCALGLVVFVLVSTPVKGEEVMKKSHDLEDWETINSNLVVDDTLREDRKSADERGRDHQASPCPNVNGTTVRYGGDLCGARSDVCSSPSLWPDVRLPCAREAKTCRATTGGGFVCASSSPHDSVRGCGEPGACPAHWRCSPLGGDFRCEPPTRFLRRVSRFRLEGDCDNEGYLCAEGSHCEDSRCVCTTHFEGKYCDEVRNYCMTKPCPGRVNCEPRLGGFNCACPANRRGVICGIHKKPTTKAMKSPHFHYNGAQQSSGIELPFCFYAISLGLSSKLTIDFGDGIITTAHAKHFLEDHNLRVNLLKVFLPPLMVPFSCVGAYFLAYHTYENPGYYDIQVKVIDEYDNRLLFNTTYTVRVRPSSFCQLTLHLENCAQKPDEAVVFRLEDDIDIISSIQVNCTRAKYTLSWVMYNATSPKKTYTDSDLVELDDNIETTGSSLHIPKFNLTLGMYVVRLGVEMLEPNYYNTSATTWFVISEDAPIPKIDGGTFLQFFWNRPVILDASVTRDMSYESERELLKTYRFYWSCKLTVESESKAGRDYCASGKPYLYETGPKLVIPPKTLYNETTYDFTVAINDPDNSLSVIVSVVDGWAETLKIDCVENCGEKINPEEVTLMRASSEAGTLIDLDTHVCKWSVSKIGNKNETWNLQENQTEFGFNFDTLLIASNVLNFSSNYLFNFRSFSTDGININDVELEATGQAEIARPTRDLLEPLEHNCTISPQSGVSVFTNFTINCDVGVTNTLLVFEVSQIERPADLNMQETWVSYGTQSEISNVRLTAGHADFNHVTSVRITITSHKLHARSETVFNVTVLPATFFTTLPDRLFREIYYQLFGVGSVLARLHAAKRSYRIIQVIRCTATEVRSLIDIQYYRFLEVGTESRKGFFRQVFVLREAMLEYLSHLKVNNLQELKHFANTTLIVLHLPTKHVLTSTNHVINAIFVNIIQTFQILKTNDVGRRDFIDLGTSLISIGSFILRETENGRNINSSESQNDIYDQEAWAVKPLLSNEERYENLLHLTSNVTQNILKCSRFFSKYLSVNSMGVSIFMDMLSLRVTKGSFRQPSKVFNLSNGILTPLFKEMYSDSVFIVSLLELHYNPYWWLSSLKNNIFPLVSIKIIFNDIAETSLPLRGRIDLNPLKDAPEGPLIHGKLKIVPFWMLDESHIQIYRFTVQKGGKLALYFTPVQEKIQIVIQKDIRPTMYDFWNDAITLPEAGKEDKNGSKSLIIVEHIKLDREQFVYVGVIPHVDTLRKLLDSDNKMYRFHSPNVVSDEDDPSWDNEFDNVAHIRESQPQDNNTTLPFSFKLQIANCYNFNQATQEMEDTCFVSKSDSFMIACTCEEIRNPVFKMESVYGRRSIFTDTMFSITAKENPVILIVMLYIISIFLGLFIWAWFADRDERMKRGAIFLRDNDPTHGYTYVLMVFTGCGPRSGTTSNVAVQLVGEHATSGVHILSDGGRPVLGRGSHEWFVLKTSRALGDVSWLNLWHDHSGASPAWHCDKVIVHDIDTHEVWVFVAVQWLAPLHGDGSMSCSVDQMLDLSIFDKRNRFREYFAHGCDVGQHGWCGMLLKRTGGGCFTRRQRVGVTLAYVAVITAVVAHMYAARGYDDAAHVLSAGDVVNGVYAALIASPVYVALYWLFHCIEPSPHWQHADMYGPRSVMFKTSGGSIHPRGGDDDSSPTNDRESRTKLPYTITKVGERTKQSTNTPTPIQGKIIEDELFCLPVWSVYIAWALLIVIIATCVYVSTFQGIMFSHIMSICFLISFVSAILASMLLETVKVALIALFYSVFIRTRVMAVEDRSEYVRHYSKLHEEKDERLVSLRLGELKLLRQKAMYKPIPQDRVQLLRRTAISEATARHVVGDVSIFLLFSIILACILYGIRHPNQCVYVHTIKNLIHSSRTDLYQIYNQDEFIKYINNTIIPNIHTEFQYSENRGEGQLADSSNYLIGVPRVRQVRLSRDSCKTLLSPHANWASHCSHNHFWIEGDTKNYGPSWKKTREENDTNTKMWSHESAWNLSTPPGGGNISTYTGGGYVALLARTEDKSRHALEHLHATRWLDGLTVALFVEFALYNANLKVASAVRVLGERTVAGGYHVTTGVAAVKLDPSGDLAKTIALVVFVALMWLAVAHMRAESNRIVRLSATRYTGDRWYALRVVVVVLGVFAICLFVVCVAGVEPSLRKLRAPDAEEFVNFYAVAYWAEILTAVLAFMFFLVVLELWHVLSFYFEFQVMITTLHVASYPILCYFVVLSIFLLGFVWTGHLLFAPTSYKFRSVWSSIVALCSFSRQHVFFRDVSINTFESSLGFCRGGFYFVFFVTYVFIFRWGFAVILMEKYKKVVTFARDTWLDPILNKHVRAKVASRPFLRMKKMTRDYVQAMTALFLQEASASRLSPARFLAMQQIVSQFGSRPPAERERPEFLSSARSLAMAALVVGRMADGKETPGGSVDRANPLVGTYFRMNDLRNKINKLNDVVTNMVDNEEI